MPSQYVNLMLGTKISAANEDRVRNNPINAVQIRLQASFIGQKDCVILPQLSARLGLRQGQDRERGVPFMASSERLPAMNRN